MQGICPAGHFHLFRESENEWRSVDFGPPTDCQGDWTDSPRRVHTDTRELGAKLVDGHAVTDEDFKATKVCQ